MIPQLDLHGVKHEDVSRRCDKFLTSIWGNHDCVDIITGNSEQMKQVVVEALESYDVEIRPALYNSAILRVYL